MTHNNPSDEPSTVNKESQQDKEKIRFALAMRLTRSAIGMNQQEFADELNIAKSTVARNETLEMSMRADTLTALLRLMAKYGIEMDLLGSPDTLTLKLSETTFNQAQEKLRRKQ